MQSPQVRSRKIVCVHMHWMFARAGFLMNLYQMYPLYQSQLIEEGATRARSVCCVRGEITHPKASM